METKADKFLFKNGKIYDLETKSFKAGDIVIENGKITDIKIESSEFKGEIVDLKGK